jgi:hypothetical protein
VKTFSNVLNNEAWVRINDVDTPTILDDQPPQE